jgi:hypothetical protein
VLGLRGGNRAASPFSRCRTWQEARIFHGQQYRLVFTLTMVNNCQPLIVGVVDVAACGDGLDF